MMRLRGLAILFSCATVFISVASTSDCSRSLPSYNDSNFPGGQFSTGGVQLLIPSWNFSCQDQGIIKRWFAHVTGNTSIADLLEFQIFRSESNSEDLYHLVYHNTLEGSTVNGSMLTKEVDGLLTGLFLPVRNGYIVGVYLPPNTDFNINLLYDTDGDTDVYYWKNLDNRTCNFSLCSGKIMRTINLFIGWEFMDSPLGLVEDKVEQKLAEDTNYCQWSSLQCNNTTDTSVSPLSSSSSTSLSATSKKASMPTTTQSDKLSTKLVPKPSISSMSALTSISIASSASLDSTVTTSSGLLNVSPLQLYLIATVILLLLITIIILVLLLLLVFTRRCKKHALVNSEEEQPAIRAHVDTSVNPSYTALAIYDAVQDKKHTPNIYSKPRSNNQLYEEVEESCRKDYGQVEVQDYCIPSNKLAIDPSDTYDNKKIRNELLSKQDEYIYEDMDLWS